MTFQILNLQDESYKTGIQAGPTIHTFSFSYFSLHFHENALLLSSLIERRWVGLQSQWRLQLKDLSIDEMVGAWCFGCCQAHKGLPVGFLLLRYSVLCTVEPLSLLYFYWPFQGGTSFVDHLYYLCLVIVIFLRLFIAALWSPAGKGLTSLLLFVMFIVVLLLSHVVFWVRCGTWFYRFLIFAIFLTFTILTFSLKMSFMQ